jgi:16S rRNA C967 or C1407 C5-methylase (RsmB/RsmF family)
MGTCKTGKRKRMNKSARARERKQLGLLQNDKHASATKVEVYDCILVDAECSTDGSLKHIQQQAQKGSAQEIQNVRLLKQQDELVPLQQKLLLSGFELLKPGGVLVYSTCSLSVHQNEGIVQWLLHRNSSAKLIPICRFLDQSFVREGSIPGTLRFLPSTEGAGGFFVAKLEKKGTPSR